MTPARFLMVTIFLVSVLLGYRLLRTFVNSSCDIKINIKIVKIAVETWRCTEFFCLFVVFIYMSAGCVPTFRTCVQVYLEI